MLLSGCKLGACDPNFLVCHEVYLGGKEEKVFPFPRKVFRLEICSSVEVEQSFSEGLKSNVKSKERNLIVELLSSDDYLRVTQEWFGAFRGTCLLQHVFPKYIFRTHLKKGRGMFLRKIFPFSNFWKAMNVDSNLSLRLIDIVKHDMVKNVMAETCTESSYGKQGCPQIGHSFCDVLWSLWKSFYDSWTDRRIRPRRALSHEFRSSKNKEHSSKWGTAPHALLFRLINLWQNTFDPRQLSILFCERMNCVEFVNARF